MAFVFRFSGLTENEAHRLQNCSKEIFMTTTMIKESSAEKETHIKDHKESTTDDEKSTGYK